MNNQPYITQKIGVVTIQKGEEVVGVIINDTKNRVKRMYKCVPMDEEDITNLIEGYDPEKKA